MAAGRLAIQISRDVNGLSSRMKPKSVTNGVQEVN
jgi:hypothetical protein